MAKRIMVLVAVLALVALAVALVVRDSGTPDEGFAEPPIPSVPQPTSVLASEDEDSVQTDTAPGSDEVSSDSPCGTLATCDVYAFQDGTSGFWKYEVRDRTWVSLAGTPSSARTAPGLSLCYDGGNYVYAFQGGTTAFWRYDIEANAWSVMAAAPGVVGDGGSLTCGFDGSTCAIYATQGGGTTSFWRYDIADNAWTTTLSRSDASIGAGGDICYRHDSAASRYYIYVLCGGGTNRFLRYDIGADSWDSLADVSRNIGAGSSMVLGEGYIYCLQETGATRFLRYSISADTWSVMAGMPANLRADSWLSYCLAGKQIYVVQPRSASLYLYSVTTNSWRAYPPAGSRGGGASDDDNSDDSSDDDIVPPGTLNLEVDGNDEANTVKFTVTAAGPGQGGTGTWTLVNTGTTPGYIDLESISVTNAENYDVATNEAEAAEDVDTSDATGGGELGANLDVVLFIDVNSDGVADAGETVIYAGKLDAIAASYDQNLPLAAGGTTWVSLTWSVDISVGNSIMGDSATLNTSIELSETSGQ